MISKEQYYKIYKDREKVIKDFLNEEYTKAKQDLLTLEDPKERERALNNFQSINYYINYFENETKLNRPIDLDERYENMQDITNTLGKAFTCRWINDTDFEVETKHENLSDFAYMLQDWFGVKSTSGFTFGSSFTEHQGATKDGLGLRITISDNNLGLIRFCVDPGCPYFISRADYEKRLKKVK